MAIFSLMVLLGSTALDQSLQRYQGLLGKELGLWQFTKNIWLGKSLGSMIDYYVPVANGQWAPYFMGSQSNLSYISLAPLAGDLPVAVWIKQEKNAENKRQLVYYEIPVYTKMASDLERDEVFGDYKRGNAIPIVEGADTIGLTFFASIKSPLVVLPAKPIMITTPVIRAHMSASGKANSGGVSTIM